jgi:hypothetical protein
VPALTIKGLSEELYRRLKAEAEASHRSLNSQAIVCIERGLIVPRRDPGAVLAELRRWHRRLGKSADLDDAFLRRARGEGRR